MSTLATDTSLSSTAVAEELTTALIPTVTRIDTRLDVNPISVVLAVSIVCILSPITVTGNSIILAAFYKYKRLRTASNCLLVSLAISDFGFVGVTFWVLMFVDRELVLPKALDPYFPWWLNHLMHTMIMVTTVFEMIVAPRQYPKRSRGLGILVSFMLVYLIWIHVIYYKSGIWVYPVMDVLTQPLRILFFAVLLAFCTILYFVGETLNNIVWGNEHTKHKKSHAKSK